MARVQIRDVAARAGVSTGTVSNVLNGSSSVKAANRERVLAAMNELGFVPNLHARTLRSDRSDAMGLVVHTLANPFFSEFAQTAVVAAEEEGATLILGSSDLSTERESRYMRLFEQSRVRGLLIAPVECVTDEIRAVRDRGTPVVLLDDHAGADEFCCTSLDGVAAGQLAVSHLLSEGRRRIVVIGGPLLQIADRFEGAERAVSAVPGASLSYVAADALTIGEGQNAAGRLLQLPAELRPDAIFGANDVIALGIMQGLIAGGVRVPEDIAIIGYDDIDAAATASVPLSSIAQPREAIAHEAVQLLLREEEALEAGNPHVHERRLLAPVLRARASTVVRH